MERERCGGFLDEKGWIDRKDIRAYTRRCYMEEVVFRDRRSVRGLNKKRICGGRGKEIDRLGKRSVCWGMDGTVWNRRGGSV